MLGRSLLEVLGPLQPLTTSGEIAGTREITLADGDAAFATVRALKNPVGLVAVVQGRNDALASWRSTTALTVTLSATTGFVVLILGFAFHWQATRAREADIIHDTVRCRIDTALNRGRCGLWDWDLARGRVFWSHSMYDLLGLPKKDDLLTFGEVNALVHHDDINLYQLASQLAETKVQSIDHAFRMRHADGKWLWLRARCELAQQDGEDGPHLIGIAVDITEQKNLVERTVAADLRLRDAIETIPEAFVLWDADNRLVLCNSNFQQLHHLPDDAVEFGHALRNHRRRRQDPDHPHHGGQRRRPAARRPHLRGAARRRPLDAYQRAPHQGRRLRLGRHRYHQAQAARAEAGRRRESARSPPSSTCANRSARSKCRPPHLPISPANMPKKKLAPRTPIRRNRNSSPI